MSSIPLFMHKIITILGLVIVVLGIILLAIFPSIFYKSAKEVNIENYRDGEKISVYGVITDIAYLKIFNITQITLDGSLKVYAPGKITSWHEGDEVYVEIEKNVTLKIGNNELAIWVTSPSNIHSVSEIRNYLYTIIISGAIVGLIGVLVRK